MSKNFSYRKIAEEILGRKLKEEDGIAVALLNGQEKLLGVNFPNELKEFYRLLGNISLFVEGFQRFANVEELFIKDHKLVFLQENQSVVYWAVDLADQQTVYQTSHQDFEKDVDWYKEEFSLSVFLEMLLYFQAVMSDEEMHYQYNTGFKEALCLTEQNSQQNPEVQAFLLNLEKDFQKVITADSLSIYKDENSIVLVLYNLKQEVDSVFAVTKSHKITNLWVDYYSFEVL